MEVKQFSELDPSGAFADCIAHLSDKMQQEMHVLALSGNFKGSHAATSAVGWVVHPRNDPHTLVDN